MEFAATILVGRRCSTATI